MKMAVAGMPCFVIRAAVAATLPATYLGLPLASYRISPLGNGNWDVVARHDSREPKDSSYTFDTGGGTQHIIGGESTAAAVRCSVGRPDILSLLRLRMGLTLALV